MGLSYATGTVSVVQGSDIVTGTGTAFTEAMADYIIVFENRRVFQIKSILNTTEFQLVEPYGFDSASGLRYFMFNAQNELGPIVEAINQLLQTTADLQASASSIANSKLAAAPALTLKGNNTSAAAQPVDLTVAQIKAMLGITIPDIPGLSLALQNASGGTASTNGGGTLDYPVWGKVVKTVNRTFDSLFLPSDFVWKNDIVGPILNDPDAALGSTKALSFNGPLSNNANEWFEIPVFAQGSDTLVKVRYHTNGEQNFDGFHLNLDGNEVFNDRGNNAEFKEFSFNLASGAHTLRFLYTSDGSAQGGFQNCHFSQIIYPAEVATNAYHHGDTVSHSASNWFCRVPYTSQEPGTGDHWIEFGGDGSGNAGDTPTSAPLKITKPGAPAQSQSTTEIILGNGLALQGVVPPTIVDGQTVYAPASVTATGPEIIARGSSDVSLGTARQIAFSGAAHVTLDTSGVDPIAVVNVQTPILTGGLAGQALFKNSATEGDTSWRAPHEVPAAGSTRQFLGKNSDTDYDAGWLAIHEVPAGGNTGFALRKSSNTDYAYSWQPSYELPSGGTTGQVLTKQSSAAGAFAWADATGGSGGTGGDGSRWDFAPLSSAGLEQLPNASKYVTLTDDADVGLIVEGGSPDGDYTRGACLPISDKTKDWVLETKILGIVTNHNYASFGVLLADSVTGNFARYGMTQTEQQISVETWNAPDGGYRGAPYVGVINHGQASWYRVEHTGGQYRFSVSYEGKAWVELWRADDTFVNANKIDKVGLVISYNRSSGPAINISCPYWSLSGEGA